jgi:hypothetical protein
MPQLGTHPSQIAFPILPGFGMAASNVATDAGGANPIALESQSLMDRSRLLGRAVARLCDDGPERHPLAWILPVTKSGNPSEVGPLDGDTSCSELLLELTNTSGAVDSSLSGHQASLIYTRILAAK